MSSTVHILLRCVVWDILNWVLATKPSKCHYRYGASSQLGINLKCLRGPREIHHNSPIHRAGHSMGIWSYTMLIVEYDRHIVCVGYRFVNQRRCPHFPIQCPINTTRIPSYIMPESPLPIAKMPRRLGDGSVWVDCIV